MVGSRSLPLIDREAIPDYLAVVDEYRVEALARNIQRHGNEAFE